MEEVMNRLAKFFRISDGIFLLAGIMAVFLPLFVISQENYPIIQYSGFDYIKSLFGHGGVNSGNGLQGNELIIVIFLVIVPLLLSLVSGIISITGSTKQIVPGIGSVIVMCLYIILYDNINILEPERLNDAQIYEKGTGIWLMVFLSICAVISGIASIITMPRIKKDAKIKEDINGFLSGAQSGGQEAGQPPVQTFMPQHGNIQDTIIKDTNLQDTGAQDDVEDIHVDIPRGAMFGLSGDYKGAQITFQPGEPLSLGRDKSNNLVFVGTKRVSRFHCTLEWLPDKQKYQIIDKSANGSFIEGREECLPQNIAVFIEPGTVLYIGSRENSFILG